MPVRFTESADRGLAEVSRRSGLSKAELIRLATDEFLQRVTRSGVIEQRIVLADPSMGLADGRGAFSSSTLISQAGDVLHPVKRGRGRPKKLETNS